VTTIDRRDSVFAYANASRGVVEHSTLRQPHFYGPRTIQRFHAGIDLAKFASFLIGRLHAPARKI
jgi:hypothetical protein